jgi:PPOX class probable F420-dependent enzyme
MSPDQLSDEAIEFLTERHLGTLTTLRPDGSPHVVAIGFTFDRERSLVRVITFASATKAHNASHGGRAAVCQVDGGRWITLEGVARITSDAVDVASGVDRYAARYRQPKERTDRVVIEIAVDRVLGSAMMKAS